MENLQAKIGEHMIEIQGAMHIFVLYLGEDAQMPVQYARWEIPVDTQLECYECMPGRIGTDRDDTRRTAVRDKT